MSDAPSGIKPGRAGDIDMPDELSHNCHPAMQLGDLIDHVRLDREITETYDTIVHKMTCMVENEPIQIEPQKSLKQEDQMRMIKIQHINQWTWSCEHQKGDVTNKKKVDDAAARIMQAHSLGSKSWPVNKLPEDLHNDLRPLRKDIWATTMDWNESECKIFVNEMDTRIRHAINERRRRETLAIGLEIVKQLTPPPVIRMVMERMPCPDGKRSPDKVVYSSATPVWIILLLRQVDRKDQIIAEKDRIIVEKDRMIAEKDHNMKGLLRLCGSEARLPGILSLLSGSPTGTAHSFQ
ncbi:MAG: hypothetical protein Q9227_006607 [Pyrenula ochraceoflavens]